MPLYEPELISEDYELQGGGDRYGHITAPRRINRLWARIPGTGVYVLVGMADPDGPEKEPAGDRPDAPEPVPPQRKHQLSLVPSH